MKKKYTVSILLTKYEDVISKIIYYLTGRGYTHASIGVDESEDVYYSFNSKGFRIELPKKHKDKIVESVCYKLKVTEEEYEKIVKLINEFQKKRSLWKYSTLGVILCTLRIPHKRKRHYFCSQFVAEVLQRSNIVKTEKSASLYTPNKLEQELRNLINLNEIVMNPV